MSKPRKGDSKGYTVALLHLPNGKIIKRTNLSCNPHFQIKLFGIQYNSWHAEARLVYFLMNNLYYLKLIELAGELRVTVLRFNKHGKPSPNSKPCSKCQKLFKYFKKHYLPNTKIVITYTENGKYKEMVI